MSFFPSIFSWILCRAYWCLLHIIYAIKFNLFRALLWSLTHSSTLAWKIPWTEEPGRLQSMGSRRVDTTERLHFHFSLSCIGEGNGNPLQCSCLENPRDGEAWWAAVYGVGHSWCGLAAAAAAWSLTKACGHMIPVTIKMQNTANHLKLLCIYFWLYWVFMAAPFFL